MRSVYRFLATSDHWAATGIRRLRRALLSMSLPGGRAFGMILTPLVGAVRSTYYFCFRIFVCEPLLKAQFTSVGRNFHGGAFLPWIQGSGDIVVGDHVRVEGLLQVFFAARYAQRPQLTIGDHTGIGHDCSIVVGRMVAIGKNCRLGARIRIFDSPGHPADPADRLAGLPARDEDVRPVRIGDNVWLGTDAVIFPGVTIGDNSIVASGAVVVTDVPQDVIVAGNPARRVQTLLRDASQAS